MSNDALHRIKILESQLKNAIEEIVKLQSRVMALETREAQSVAPRTTITLKK